ncbi:MAG: vitamin B12-dependent ribonucleotide reductase [Bacillota bacterium]|nr:vitamin B12-dependent ribonucleotide reductase [Bacillota bacterium]
MNTISENAITVLERRYLRRNENNEIDETVEELFHRVASFIAGAEEEYGWGKDEIDALEAKFYKAMTELDFLPNSPTLMNAGLPLGQLSACFVLPVEDSMEHIFETVKNTALIHKSGGGTGFSFSRLRSKGATVQSTGGVASGPISFMKVFNTATEAVKQGGKRRGANMGILRVDHPDIIRFIKAKEDNNELTNFNLSVWLTDSFMQALESGSDYPLIEPSTGAIVNTLNAKKVFDIIVEKAWLNGEPGIVFMDQINKKNPVPHLGSVESTNPCGEQPLLPYESCNLGSINLINFYEDGLKGLNFHRLGEIVDLSVHFLDNVIDKNLYPIPEIAEKTRSTRKIGLGVMGFADVLCRMGISYNSQAAVDMAEKIMSFMDSRSKEASMALAARKGTFPAYKGSVWEAKDMPLRNATTTTIAPTGTISMIAGSSSGIEPLFGIAYYKLCMDGDKLMEVHPYFKQVAKDRGFYSEEVMAKVIEEGSIANISEIPQDVKDVFVTTRDIDPEWHIKIQSAFQKYTDNAVSKTINFPFTATKEDIAKAYLMAFKEGCKGITVYRDGSRDEQVLNVGSGKEKDAPQNEHEGIAPRQRPGITQGMTEKAIAGCGNLYITVNYDEEGICEVFTNLGKGGGCPSQTEATSRLVSLAMRSGISASAVIEQLKGIRCPSTLARRAKGADVRALSCPDAIAKTLERVLNIAPINGHDKNGLDLDNLAQEIELQGGNRDKGAKCPECGGNLEHEGGCVLCHTCGYSKCG